MGKFENYMTEQFVGKDPNRINVGKDIFKALKENWKERIGYIPQKPMAIIQVTDPKEPNILTGIGFSEPNDILLDNFGIFLAGVINNGADVHSNVVDTNGNTQDVHFQENSTIRMFNVNETSPVALGLGGFLRLGQDSVPAPTRSDFDITTPFVTPPESDSFAVLTPAWISIDQEAIVTGLIQNTQLGGSVRECGMFCVWRIGFGTTAGNFMISHDLAFVNFGVGSNIQTTYTWSLS